MVGFMVGLSGAAMMRAASADADLRQHAVEAVALHHRQIAQRVLGERPAATLALAERRRRALPPAHEAA